MTNLKSRFLPALAALLILGPASYSVNLQGAGAASLLTPRTLILYDAASGTLPSAPLMGFLGLPQDAVLLTYTDGAADLDTTLAGNDTYAGWVATGAASLEFPTLDRAAGFQVNFTVQVENESHARDSRAGFSVILLSQDAKGIELAFWQDRIWAQGDDATGGLFSHGEGAAFDTVSGPVEYQLTIAGDTYTLTANGETILSGPIRDYGAFNGFPDPYETPNFLFLGDNTTSAQGRIRLSFVSVTGTDPVLQAAGSTSTATETPLPTASSTSLPSPTSVPSPTPTEMPSGLCPSGWIFLIVVLSATWIRKNTRTG
jgi:hypothetical protein